MPTQAMSRAGGVAVASRPAPPMPTPVIRLAEGGVVAGQVMLTPAMRRGAGAGAAVVSRAGRPMPTLVMRRAKAAVPRHPNSGRKFLPRKHSARR